MSPWLLVMVLAAQGGGAQESSAAPPLQLGPPTQIELVSKRLNLDSKTQGPVVQQILVDASQEAAPVVQQLLQFRQQFVNWELAGQSAELQTVLPQYAAAAAKLAAIEAAAFKKIYAELKDNQRQHAAEAFSLMAGIFYPPATGGGAAGGGRGRGGR